MVEIQQQQTQLRQQRASLEAQRRKVMSEQNIRKGQNRNALLQRQQQLSKINQQDSQLANQESELQKQLEQTAPRINTAQERLNEYNYGRKLALSGKGAFDLSPDARKGYVDAKQGLNAIDKFKAELKEAKAQQLQGISEQSLAKDPQVFISPPSLKNNFMSVAPTQSLNIPQYTPAPKMVGDVSGGIYQDKFFEEALKKDPQAQERLKKIERLFTQDPITETNIRNAATRQGLKPNTAEYQEFVQRETDKSKVAQSVIGAAALSVAGVPKIPTKGAVAVRQADSAFFEVKVPVTSASGKQTTISSYQIIRERTPPKVKITKNGFEAVSPKYEITSTALPSVEGSPVIAVSTKTGKTGTVESLKGIAKKVAPNQLKDLPKSEQFLFSKLAKSGPIRKLDKSTTLQAGYIETNNLGIDPIKRRFATASTERVLTSQESFKLTETSQAFKELKGNIIGNAPKAKGPTTFLRGFTLEIKKPITASAAPSESSVVSVGKTRTALSKTFAREVLQTPKPPKAAVTRSQTKTTSFIKAESAPKPYGTAGVLLGRSSGVSTGMDSGSNNFISDFTRGFAKGAGRVQETKKTKAQTTQLDLPKQTPIPRTTPISNSGSGQGSSQPQISLNLPVQQPFQIPKQTPLETPRQFSELSSLQATAQSQSQLSKALQLSRTAQPLPSRPGKPKPIPPYIRKIDDGEGFSNFAKRSRQEGLFTPEVRRFGKFRPLGEATTLEKAIRKATRTVDVNLGRSFRIKGQGGEVLDLSNLPRGFRRSKRERGVVIEESRFALSTGGEKSEIKAFKRVNGGKKNIFGL